MARCADSRATRRPSLRSMRPMLRFRGLRPPPILNTPRIDAPRSKSPRREAPSDDNRPMPIQYRRQMHHLRIPLCRMQNLRLQGRCRFSKQIKRIGLGEIQIRLHQIQNPLPLHRPGWRAEQSVGCTPHTTSFCRVALPTNFLPLRVAGVSPAHTDCVSPSSSGLLTRQPVGCAKCILHTRTDKI